MEENGLAKKEFCSIADISTVEIEKTCTKCNLSKLLEEYSPRKHGKFGKSSICKKCKAAAALVWASAHRDLVNVRARNNRPKMRKKRAEYKKKLRAEGRDWSQKHPEKMSACRKAWEEANPVPYLACRRNSKRKAAKRKRDEFLAAQPADYGKVKVCRKCKIPKVLEIFRKKSEPDLEFVPNIKQHSFGRKPYCIDCERQYWANRSPEQKDNHRQSSRKYRQENLEVVRHRSIQHHNKRRMWAGGDHHTHKEWLELLTKYGHCCLCCGIHERDAVKKQLTRDHIVPLSRGGTDTIDNIQPLCWPCNQKKNTKTIDYRLTVRVLVHS